MSNREFFILPHERSVKWSWLANQLHVLDFWIVFLMLLLKKFFFCHCLAAAHFFCQFFFPLGCCYVYNTPFFPQGFKAGELNQQCRMCASFSLFFVTDFILFQFQKVTSRKWFVELLNSTARWKHNLTIYSNSRHFSIRWFSVTDCYTRPPISSKISIVFSHKSILFKWILNPFLYFKSDVSWSVVFTKDLNQVFSVLGCRQRLLQLSPNPRWGVFWPIKSRRIWLLPLFCPLEPCLPTSFWLQTRGRQHMPSFTGIYYNLLL